MFCFPYHFMKQPPAFIPFINRLKKSADLRRVPLAEAPHLTPVIKQKPPLRRFPLKVLLKKFPDLFRGLLLVRTLYHNGNGLSLLGG